MVNTEPLVTISSPRGDNTEINERTRRRYG
jgi:hypothetical protein